MEETATVTNEDVDEINCVPDSELEALQSIYINEIEVNGDDEQKCTIVSIDLHPATADNVNEQYVRMTLKFTLNEKYPDIVPEIAIRNPRGLSDEKLNSISQDLLSIAESKKGNSMLFEIIEAAKEHLTTGNRPSGECAICLYGFSENDVFTRTECYHYFHSHCLARYSKNTGVEEENLQDGASSQELLCPMCRKPIHFQGSEDLYPPPVASDDDNFIVSDEILSLQKKMAELYQKQMEKGGIIDIEAEKNKYLIEISNVPDRVTVVEKLNSTTTITTTSATITSSSSIDDASKKFEESESTITQAAQKDKNNAMKDKNQKSDFKFNKGFDKHSEGRRYDRYDRGYGRYSNDNYQSGHFDKNRKHDAYSNRRSYNHNNYGERRRNNQYYSSEKEDITTDGNSECVISGSGDTHSNADSETTKSQSNFSNDRKFNYKPRNYDFGRKYNSGYDRTNYGNESSNSSYRGGRRSNGYCRSNTQDSYNYHQPRRYNHKNNIDSDVMHNVPLDGGDGLNFKQNSATSDKARNFSDSKSKQEFGKNTREGFTTGNSSRCNKVEENDHSTRDRDSYSGEKYSKNVNFRFSRNGRGYFRRKGNFNHENSSSRNCVESEGERAEILERNEADYNDGSKMNSGSNNYSYKEDFVHHGRNHKSSGNSRRYKCNSKDSKGPYEQHERNSQINKNSDKYGASDLNSRDIKSSNMNFDPNTSDISEVLIGDEIQNYSDSSKNSRGEIRDKMSFPEDMKDLKNEVFKSQDQELQLCSIETKPVVDMNELTVKSSQTMLPPPPGFANPLKKVIYGLQAANPPPGFHRS